ncbi:hypothetical protein [Nakamurella deserti]|uniref:hypothetical protein n=1 Tax=Nakamurella deserti TaxID=2164074 RepID=UPI000DBE6429|nr:hypothetical protein [Nakamurella deserti]
MAARRLAGVVCAVLALTACTTPDDATPTPGSTPVTVSAGVVATGTAGSLAVGSTQTSPTDAPVTQLGLLTGPGVDDRQITLGTLIDPAADRGFRQGLELWRQSANAAGGVCNRSVVLADAGVDDVPRDLPDAYRALGGSVLGFVTATTSTQVRSELATLLSADRIPALTVEGTATDLLATSPVVIGPTADVIAANAADELLRTGVLATGGRLGVVSDGADPSRNAVDGLRWFAARHDLTLVVQTGQGRDVDVLSTLPVVFALGDAALTATLADALPADTTVVTTLDGYDPTLIDAAAAAHLRVALSTPAVGADHPGAKDVAAAVAAGGGVPGVSTFAGYAAGAVWQRLLVAACDAEDLTRNGVSTALTTVGPASVESLLGASDPALPVIDQQPATRSSSLAVADPSAPTGLRPLTGLLLADGIEDYVAPHAEPPRPGDSAPERVGSRMGVTRWYPGGTTARPVGAALPRQQPSRSRPHRRSRARGIPVGHPLDAVIADGPIQEEA